MGILALLVQCIWRSSSFIHLQGLMHFRMHDYGLVSLGLLPSPHVVVVAELESEAADDRYSGWRKAELGPDGQRVPCLTRTLAHVSHTLGETTCERLSLVGSENARQPG